MKSRLKNKSHNAKEILSPRGWVAVLALAWIIAPVGVGGVGSLISSAQAQTAQSDPEVLRAMLRGTLETQLETAVMTGNTDAQEIIARALDQLEQLTWEDLALLEGSEGRISALQATQNDVYDQLKVLEGVIPNLGDAVQQSSQFSSALAQGELQSSALPLGGLTSADYGSICSSNPFGSPANGPNRSDPDANQGLVTAITVSDTALVVAEGVRDIADIGCNTVVVLAGFGGNPQSPVCIISSGIYIAAKGINEGLEISQRLLTFCDATIDGAEIEGAFERASDIYDQNVYIDSDLAAHDSDLDAHDANLEAHDANLEAHDADLVAHTADLVAHDADLMAHAAELAVHDADIKALLATLQNGINENRQRLDQIINLLLTPTGNRPGFPQ